MVGKEKEMKKKIGTPNDEEIVFGWLNGGKFYCTKEHAQGGIPFAFIPKGSKCEVCKKTIGGKQ